MENLLAELKTRLTPFNPEWVNREDYDVIKMGIHSNHGYMGGKAIREAIACFENRAKAVICGIDELNALEKLAIILLLESAHMRK